MKTKLLLFLTALALGQILQAQDADWRNISNAVGEIPTAGGYCDQPYLLVLDDGSWLCFYTTGAGIEGEPGQHIVYSSSTDKGSTWSSMNAIEPADGPEASWVMPLMLPSGRIYIFYLYNEDNIREIPNCNSEHLRKRVDTMGKLMFRYSDDNGNNWSGRYEIPVRSMRIDRGNNFSGRVQQGWGVGKPIIHNDAVYFGYAKVGLWGLPGGMVISQGCFMKSDNILTEKDPAKINWETLPDGDEGLRAPKGPVSDETNLVAMNNGSLYCTYRTIDGFLCHAYSHDGGHNWTSSAYGTYSPEGERIKHNRAYCPVWKLSNGKYLLWFNNHSGESSHSTPGSYYTGRNPVWISGGIERDGFIHWSEPEIFLYDESPVNIHGMASGISYPDIIEHEGNVYITETQKTIARIHKIDNSFLNKIWNQFNISEEVHEGLILNLKNEDIISASKINMPLLPDLGKGGFSIDFWIKMDHLSEGQVVLDARDEKGKGIALETTGRSTINLIMNDGIREVSWDSDPGTHPGTLVAGKWQHVAVIVDGGPNIISFVVDGHFNDGGAVRDYGFGRFDADLTNVNGAERAEVANNLSGEIKQLRIYKRSLLTTEAIGNYRYGMR
jgi:hypothetical protein